MTFEETLQLWKTAQRESVEARLAYERIYAEAITKADGKSAEVREAQAEMVGLEAHRIARHAAVEARGLLQMLLYLQAPAGGADDHFEDLLTRWQEAQHDSVDARLDYEGAYSAALITAEGKTAEVRKAHAKLAGSELLGRAEHADAEAQALLHTMIYLQRSSAASSELVRRARADAA